MLISGQEAKLGFLKLFSLIFSHFTTELQRLSLKAKLITCSKVGPLTQKIALAEVFPRNKHASLSCRVLNNTTIIGLEKVQALR
jgi:hypothetical protein